MPEMMDANGNYIPQFGESSDFLDQMSELMTIFSLAETEFNEYVDSLPKDIEVEYDDGSTAVLNPSRKTE